ncbi:hypothetical protein Tco_1466900 [Tanacetum coccineum]
MVISSPCLTDIKNWPVQSKWLMLASPKQTTLALVIPEQTTTSKETSNPFMAGSLPKTTKPTNLVLLCSCVASLLRCCNEKLKNFKISKSSSSSKKGLKNRSVFEYILLTFKKLILKKHEVSLDLSRLATTLNRLERSNQIRINKWYLIRLATCTTEREVFTSCISTRRPILDDYKKGKKTTKI